MRKYKPLMCKVIVRIIKESLSKGGIIIPDNSLEHKAKEEGILLAVGTYAFDEDEVKPQIGDKVAISRYAGKTLEVDKDGNDIRVMKDEDILVVIED